MEAGRAQVDARLAAHDETATAGACALVAYRAERAGAAATTAIEDVAREITAR